MPVQAVQRWHIERTNAWHNAFSRLTRYYERRQVVVEAFFDLAGAIITIRSLTRRVRTTHRWDTRPEHGSRSTALRSGTRRNRTVDPRHRKAPSGVLQSEFGGRCQPRAATGGAASRRYSSTRRAAASVTWSCHGRATIWTATGRPWRVPTGTTATGAPVRLHGSVQW